MVDHDTGFMVIDPDSWLGPRPIARPLYMACDYVFRSLQPLEANNRSSPAFRLTAIHTTVRKFINLLACNSGFDQLNAGFQGNAQPWIRYGSIEFVRIESMNDAPCFSAEGNYFLSGSKSQTFR